MKLESKLSTGESSVEALELPCLVVHKEKKYVVLARYLDSSGDYHGTVVFSADPAIELGKYFNSFCASDFEVYDGTVTLNNKA